VIKVGRRLVVPTAPILALLGIDDSGPGNRSQGPGQDRSAQDAQPGLATAGDGAA
jgi:hypothetical protein